MSWTEVNILELNVPSSRTGLVYSEEVVSKAIQHLETSYAAFFNKQADIPLTLPLESITHMIRNVRTENGWLKAEVNTLDVPLVHKLQEMFPNTPFKILPVAAGVVFDNNIVKEYSILYFRSEIP